MFLAHAIAVDEDALVCDFAETYHLFDYRALPPRTAAALCAGLSRDSRIKRKLSGQKVDTKTLLLAIIADHLGAISWRQTKDGHYGRNRPESILKIILDGDKAASGKVRGYNTAEEFEAARREIIGREG